MACFFPIFGWAKWKDNKGPGLDIFVLKLVLALSDT